MAGETPQSGEVSGEQRLQGLLLTGEGVAFLTDEHRELLRQVASVYAGGRAVELTVFRPGGTEGSVHEQAENETQPVPATYEDFHTFAAQHGYTDQQAARAYTRIVSTQEAIEAVRSHGKYADILRSYPPIRILGKDDQTRARHKIIDLRSVYERFVAADLDTKAWDRASPRAIAFIARLVNEKVEPDEPLPTDPNFYRLYR